MQTQYLLPNSLIYLSLAVLSPPLPANAHIQTPISNVERAFDRVAVVMTLSLDIVS
jgi:hypothetical protein